MPSKDAGTFTIRVERGRWPWTVDIVVYDRAGEVVERWRDKRLESTPWWVCLWWRILDRLEGP